MEGHPERIEDILKDPARKVTDIPGIGKGLALVLQEICERGSCERRDTCSQKFPPTALEFLKIQGLGPKGIALIFEHYRISTIDELERLCQEQKLRMLPRMGAKLEEKVLRSIAQYRQRTGRFLLSSAEDTARELIDYLGAVAGHRRDHAGRQPAARPRDRRRSRPAGHRTRRRRGARPLRRLAQGGRGAGARREQGQRQGRAATACRWTCAPCPRESFGAALQYFTGSKDHNIVIRQRALKHGPDAQRVRPVPRSTTTRSVAGVTEEEVYAALGLRLDSARAARKPGRDRLRRRASPARACANSRHIRGDIHMHTTETDGRASLEEMAAAAKAKGYEYIAITDHSKALAMANGLDEAARRGLRPTGARVESRRPRHPHLLRPGVRHPEGRRARPGQRCAGRARLGDRQRPQPHEPGAGGDDGSPAARAGVPAPARSGPSHRAHSDASRSLSRSTSSAWWRRR